MRHNHTIEDGRLGRYNGQGSDKLRGGYYTSPEVAAWLCEWAIRGVTDRVLESSCGDGIFLIAALERFTRLGACSPARISKNLIGVKVVQEEAERARQRLLNRFGSGVGDVIQTGDFFDSWLRSRGRTFDVVVGNPPLIRYQSFPEPYRSRAMEIMTELGLKPNHLTNI